MKGVFCVHGQRSGCSEQLRLWTQGPETDLPLLLMARITLSSKNLFSSICLRSQYILGFYRSLHLNTEKKIFYTQTIVASITADSQYLSSFLNYLCSLLNSCLSHVCLHHSNNSCSTEWQFPEFCLPLTRSREKY